MKYKLNQILVTMERETLENSEIGQRVLIPGENCTGRHIGENKVVYVKDEEPRMIKIMDKIISNENISCNSLEYKEYQEIMEKIRK